MPTVVAALIDTNVLIYRHDWRFPEKQSAAEHLLRELVAHGTAFLPHQAIVEFVSVITRPAIGRASLLSRDQALIAAEELMVEFPILFPNESLVRTALRGAAAYQLSWYDAHLWAYAEFFGLSELISEDFTDGRFYGSVRVVNPFGEPGLVHEG